MTRDDFRQYLLDAVARWAIILFAFGILVNIVH